MSHKRLRRTNVASTRHGRSGAQQHVLSLGHDDMASGISLDYVTCTNWQRHSFRQLAFLLECCDGHVIGWRRHISTASFLFGRPISFILRASARLVADVHHRPLRQADRPLTHSLTSFISLHIIISRPASADVLLLRGSISICLLRMQLFSSNMYKESHAYTLRSRSVYLSSHPT